MPKRALIGLCLELGQDIGEVLREVLHELYTGVRKGVLFAHSDERS